MVNPVLVLVIVIAWMNKMNQVLKDCVNKCTNTFTSYFDGRGNVTETHFDKEKFAKLIINECIDAATQAQAYHYIIYNIRSRFGIEQ